MDKCENILFLEFFFRISIHFRVMSSSFVSFEKKIYCTFSSFLIFFSKRNLEKLVTVVFVKGKSTLVLNYSHWPCQASILTIQRGDFSKTTLIGKKSNYVIQLFERQGRNKVFHFRFAAICGKLGSFGAGMILFFIFTAKSYGFFNLFLFFRIFRIFPTEQYFPLILILSLK